MAEPYLSKEKRAAETDDHPLIRDGGRRGKHGQDLAYHVDALRSPHNAHYQTQDRASVVTTLCGIRYERRRARTHTRYGPQGGNVTLCVQKLSIERP